MAANYGSKDATIDPTLLSLWTERLEDLLEVQPDEGITLKEEVEFKSPLNSALWDAWINTKHVMGWDEDANLASWQFNSLENMLSFFTVLLPFRNISDQPKASRRSQPA